MIATLWQRTIHYGTGEKWQCVLSSPDIKSEGEATAHALKAFLKEFPDVSVMEVTSIHQ